MLLESLLCWEQWLKKDRMKRREVSNSCRAHRHLMRLVEFVAPRSRGMKHCRIKFHLGLHIAGDVLDFGVPANVDSTPLECSHKTNMKVTAANTQRRKLKLNMQIAQRLSEKYCYRPMLERNQSSSNSYFITCSRASTRNSNGLSCRWSFLCEPQRKRESTLQLEGIQEVEIRHGQRKAFEIPCCLLSSQCEQHKIALFH